MSSKEESGIFKLIPRLGRRSAHGSTQKEKSDDEMLESVESLSSGKSSSKGPAPIAPPRTRKTGWADDLKSAKHKRNSSAVDQEGYLKNNNNSKDDIPNIPDIDELIEDTALLDISNVPPPGANRTAAAYKELDTDITKNKLYAMMKGVDLTLLTDKLYPEHLVQEPNEIWTWDSLFTQVASEMNSEMQKNSKEKQ